jgi:hypothetical protein
MQEDGIYAFQVVNALQEHTAEKFMDKEVPQ